MNAYQQISLLPDADIALYFLWQKCYQQIHLALAENQCTDKQSAIGVSFPEYDATGFSLGRKLRLFAPTEAALQQLDVEKWLSRLRDYVHISSTKPVPDRIDRYVCFRHVRPKGSKENLARRRAKRKGETIDEALAHYADYQSAQLSLPYINMRSETNGHHFRLFIEKHPVEQPQKGRFSCYGLSKTATVPWF